MAGKKRTKNGAVAVSNTTGEGDAMSTGKTSTGKTSTRGDFKVLETRNEAPANVDFDPNIQGRYRPVGDQVITELADSMRVIGQQQPIQIRKGTDGRWKCVFGNSRLRAAKKLADGYESKGANGQPVTVSPDPSFTLRCEVVDCDDETAFLANIVENAQRTACSPMDNARNHQRLRDEFQMSDATITKRYGYAHQASVNRLKKLLTLEEQYQNAVDDNTMTQAAAFLLADVPPEQRARVWLAAVDANGKSEEGIGGSTMSKAIKTVTAALKEEAAAQQPQTPAIPGAEGTPATPGEPGAATPGTDQPAQPAAPDMPNPALNLKSFKDVCTGIAKSPVCPHKVSEAMGVILSCISGEMSPQEFTTYFVNLIPGAREEFDAKLEEAKNAANAPRPLDAQGQPVATEQPAEQPTTSA